MYYKKIDRILADWKKKLLYKNKKLIILNQMYYKKIQNFGRLEKKNKLKQNKKNKTKKKPQPPI